jgi:hypothetical protein
MLKVVQFEIVQPERRAATSRAARRRVRALSRGRTPFPGPRAFPRPTPRPGAPRFFPAPRVAPRRSRRTRACRTPGGPPVRPAPRPYARRPRLPPYHGSIFVVTPTSPASRPYLRQHALPLAPATVAPAAPPRRPFGLGTQLLASKSFQVPNRELGAYL